MDSSMPASTAPDPSALTQSMPLALQTSTHPARSDEATTACATVGASAPSTMTSMASQAVS